MKYKTPLMIYGDLFIAMNKSGIWSDDKVIADLVPIKKVETILTAYKVQKQRADFSLKAFADKHFTYQAASSTFKSDTNRPIQAHIELLWEELSREADQTIAGSSLIALPYPYIVPGGRFNEIYYWDSYFTMLGLQVSKRIDLIENMVKNFAYLVDNIGFIPNGNRTYFMSRSQPPFFAAMVNLLAESKSKTSLIAYLPQLEKEYEFWMSPPRIVQVDGGVLNRYYDADPSPRAEMYATDIQDAQAYNGEITTYYTHLKAACESGWDFSSRWLHSPDELVSIHTTDILPVDLNCLLYHLEQTIAAAYFFDKKEQIAKQWQTKAQQRKALINRYLWSDTYQFYMDYDAVNGKTTDIISAAGLYPLFFHIAPTTVLPAIVQTTNEHLLRAGGIVCTPHHSGQQWDAPNGWAPLQWIAYKGFQNYKQSALANLIKNRWTTLCIKVYQNTGKLMEKYNVENLDLLSGGGEYPVQDGFGWTNGVLLRFLAEQD